MLKSIIAFCLSRRAIVVLRLAGVCRGGVLRLPEAQHRGLSEPDAGHPGNHRAGAGPLRRGDGALLHASRSRSGFTRRPASTSSAPRRSTGCPLSASCSSTGWTITSPMPRRRSRCSKMSPCRAARSRKSSRTARPARSIVTRWSGPKHFGLTNLRTVQDWIVLRRLSTIPGIVQVNSWGGTTKEFDVEVDPQKLEAFNVTVPQMLTALGNANINVGGREIRIGQQSINIRGVGLIDDGGSDDLTQGYKVDDIENVVLAQSNGVPVLVKDVAQGEGGLCAAARHLRTRPGRRRGGVDRGDEPHGADRQHAAQGQGRDRADEQRWEPAAGVKVVPFYDRGSLIGVTTHTVLHNLDLRLRAGLPDPVDFPRRPPQRDHRRGEYSVCPVLCHHAAGDPGGERQPALRRRGGFWHHRGFGGDPGGEYFPELPEVRGRAAGPAGRA